MSIRRATDQDRQGIWIVHARAIREVCSQSYSEEQVTSWSGLLSPASYVAAIRERFLVVCEDANSIAGFGQLNQASGEVEAVSVLPDRQREGIGTALLRSLEEAARAAGLTQLSLSATTNAVSFYEQAGYTRGASAVHRLPNGVDLPCIRMSKALP